MTPSPQDSAPRSASLRPAILAIAGVLSVMYFVLTITYVGVGLSLSSYLIWLFLGVLLLGLAWIDARDRVHLRDLPMLAKVLVGGVVGLILLSFLLIQSLIQIAAHKPPPSDLDLIIVLGAQVGESGPMPILKDRLDAATDYLQVHPKLPVIVTGGQGPDEPRPEAHVMRDYLMAHGIDGERILVEDRSTNTNENFAYSLALVPDGVRKIGIVTSNYHMFRALRLAEQQGLEQVYGLPARSDRLLLLHNYVREYFAILKDLLVGNMRLF